MAKPLEQKEEESQPAQIDLKLAHDASEQHMSKFPRTFSITHLLDMEYLGSISQLLSDNPYNSTFEFPNTIANAGTDSAEKPQLGEIPYQYMDSGKFQVNQGSSIFSQPIFLNPVYDIRSSDR